MNTTNSNTLVAVGQSTMSRRDEIRLELFSLIEAYGKAAMADGEAAIRQSFADESIDAGKMAGAIQLRQHVDRLPERVLFELSFVDRYVEDCRATPVRKIKQKKARP